MSTTANNETLERIKKEVAIEFSAGNYESFWDTLKVYGDKRMINELCVRFARAVAIDSLKEAAENATCTFKLDASLKFAERSTIQIDKSSITNESNIVLL